MQALHRREAPAAAGRGTPQAAGLFPDQSEEEKPIVQFQRGGRGRSQSHHGPGSGGRSCWPRGLGLRAGLQDFCPFVLRGRRPLAHCPWHTASCSAQTWAGTFTGPPISRAAALVSPWLQAHGGGWGRQLRRRSVTAHTQAKRFQAKIIHFNRVFRVEIAKHSSIMQKYFSIKGTCIKR